MPGGPLYKVRRKGSQDARHSYDVDIEDLGPGSIGQVAERARLRNAGMAHHQVDRAEALKRNIARALDLIRVAYVAGNRDSARQ